jgi:hypothetical protein
MRTCIAKFTVILLLGFFHAQAQENFKISGELRIRAEGRDNADFNSDRLDGAVKVLNRLRLGFLRKFESDFLIFAQLQDSRIWGEEGSTLTSLKAIDLHQAYLEIDRPAKLPFLIRLGRQQLSFGSERLLGKYDWDNVGRAFDALNLSFGREEQKLDLWLAQVRDQSAPTVARNQEFGGAYFSSQRLLPITLDAYALILYDGRNFESVANPASPGRQDEPKSPLTIYTFGARLNRQVKQRFRFDLEGTYQSGQRGFLGIGAYGIALSADYAFGSRLQPTIRMGYVFGSGDGDPNDGKSETFSNLFPDLHRHLGAMDYASWSNITSASIGASISPQKNFTCGVDWHWLSLANDHDAWYRAGGFNIGTPQEIYRKTVPNAGRHIGKEIDFQLNYIYREHLNLTLGLSNFFVGGFVKNTGGLRADDSVFGYLTVAMEF